jgi:hypothetical protein
MNILRWLWPEMRLRREWDLDTDRTSFWIDTGIGLIPLRPDQYQTLCRKDAIPGDGYDVRGQTILPR